MFSSQAQNKCAALVRLTRQVLAFFCYMTHLELGLGFGGFYFFEKENRKGKTRTEVASAQGEHPASAGEKREFYNSDKNSYMLGRCHIPAAPSSSQDGRPQLVSLPAAQNRAHRDMLGPQ